jgi:hypothetical protein
MRGTTHAISFDGAILSRGFWLYVWEITTAGGQKLYYVGRTGDSSSANAQSPFNRMGQHLGFNANSNVLRRHLACKGVSPEESTFHLVAHGPIQEEAVTDEEHYIHRDNVAAMEMALAEAMTTAGYSVINSVKSKKTLDDEIFLKVLLEFTKHFPLLGSFYK